MALDLIREGGCYKSLIRLRVEPELIAAVRWYICPPGAKWLPVEHTFGSAIWESTDYEYPWEGLGEIAPPVHFRSDPKIRRGRPPAYRDPFPGQETPTPLDWFQNGVPADAVPLSLLQRCTVSLIPWFGSGGVVLGGLAGLVVVPPAPGYYALGGVVLGGSAEAYTITPYDAAGGVLLGGSAGIFKQTHYAALGGVLVNGTVGLIRQDDYIGAGGVVLGGTLVLLAPFRYQASGGLRVGGAAGVLPVRRPFLYVGRGGPVLGGLGLRSRGSTYSAGPGGLRLSGFGSRAKGASYLATHGGPVLAGEGDWEDIMAFPVGSIIAWAGLGSPPGRWLLCDGSAVSRATYSDLYDAILTTWGAGNGTTTFNLPDFRYRFLLGSSADPPDTVGLGQTGGEKTHTLTESEIPAHVHPPLFAGDQMLAFVASGGSAGLTVGTNEIGRVSTGSTGGGASHNNMPPWACVKLFIAY